MKNLIKPVLLSSLLVFSAAYTGTTMSAPFGGYPGGCRYMDDTGFMTRGQGCLRQRGFRPGPRGPAMASGQHRLLDRLDLTQQQWDQVRAIDDDYDDAFNALRAKLQGNRQALRQLRGGTPAERQDIAQLAKARGDLVEEKIVLRAERRSRIHALLTDEQRADWTDLRQQRKRRWQ